ncbi:MAG: hypothetical protein WAW52_04095 [Methanothrix sp.]
MTGEIPGQFEYEHLLSHTFPGFFTAVTFFMLMDVWSPTRLTELVLSNYNNMIAFIGFVLLVGTIMGVILDNIHHSILEGLIFDQFDEVQLWIKKFNMLAKRNPDKLEHTDGENIVYYYFVKKLGPEAINYITHLRKAKYCYSEFYSNTFLSLVPFSVVIPFYLIKTFHIYWHLCVYISIFVLILSCISLISSYQAYLNYNKSLYYLISGFLHEDHVERQ